jgi:hypothetical protein
MTYSLGPSQCRAIFSSSIITWRVSSSSPPLHLHGSPAPHVHPISFSQARSGWFSQTHPMPKQIGQFLSI